MDIVSSLPTDGTWRVVIRLTCRSGRSGLLLSRLATLLPSPTPGSQDPLWVFVRPDPRDADTIDLVGFYPERQATNTVDDMLAMLAEAADEYLTTPPAVVATSTRSEQSLLRSGQAPH